MNFPTPSDRVAKVAVGALAAVALVAGMVQVESGRPAASAALSSATKGPAWAGAWGAAMQPPVAGDEDSGPNWSVKGFGDHSLRQVVRVGTGGSQVRIRLSNVYGTRPLKVAGAALGRSAGGAVVWPRSSRRLTFGTSASVVIPAGREVLSDPVPLAVSPLERLAVTTRFTGPTGPATFHRFALTKSYRASGDHLDDVPADAFKQSTGAWYYLSGVEVAGASGTVVAFGDSLVDGVGTTPEADARFPDRLAERLAAAGRPSGLVNAGIGSAKLLNSSACGGEKAVSRFRRDVLDRPGVRTVIVHLGANDLAAPMAGNPCVKPAPKVTARQLIDGHRELIRQARARGVKVVGVTLGPMKGALFPFWSEEIERVRQELNTWIRDGGEYDSVVDAAGTLSDPADRLMPRPGYVFMDGLHPNDAGHHALAAAIDLRAIQT
ncbi:SGNH/GDSL hydrolase family protein [Spirillospora sp. CA-294931]|uniref:SGNH/GDSL hydrolase family protein n=1 Tax=Spirillospora sp. CA-294931 TaxID=3240042 RepID=UPI003D938851